MGNGICRTRTSTVEDRFTRPQRLVRDTSDFDYKKLRKLILSEKLAPCFDGVEDSSSNNSDLEECPICFFYFPSLNRSKCCMKGICTECFLQMKPSSATLSAQCPFCKTPSYAVEFRGARTKEEKGLEQAEEQKVIEAKIRMQQRESQNANQAILLNQNSSSVKVQSTTSGSMDSSNGSGQNLRDSELPLPPGIVEVDGSPGNARNESSEEFDVDLEEIMMMEAIWQSIQDTSILKCTAQQSSRSNGTGGEIQRSNQGPASLASIHEEELQASGSVTGGIAVAIARMAERSILHPENSQSIDDSEMFQAQNENSIDHQSCTPSPIICGSDMLEVGPVASDMEPDFDDVNSENACLASCYSTTEDDSWGLHSANSLNGSQCSSDRSISDDELAPEESPDVESSCPSSVHTIPDSSCGSPNCSDTVGRLTDAHLPVERHQGEFANCGCYSMSHFRNY